VLAKPGSEPDEAVLKAQAIRAAAEVGYAPPSGVEVKVAPASVEWPLDCPFATVLLIQKTEVAVPAPVCHEVFLTYDRESFDQLEGGGPIGVFKNLDSTMDFGRVGFAPGSAQPTEILPTPVGLLENFPVRFLVLAKPGAPLVERPVLEAQARRAAHEVEFDVPPDLQAELKTAPQDVEWTLGCPFASVVLLDVVMTDPGSGLPV
jgi:hypothetical protein